MQPFRLPILAVSFGFILTFTAFSQTPAIRSAAITLVPKATTVERVTIENRRTSPMVVWEIGWVPRNATGPRTIAGSDFALQLMPAGTGYGPVQPNERRTIELSTPEGRTAGVATLRLAVFEDGHIEGLPSVVERWQKQRQEHIDDVAYWIRALEGMPRSSEDEAKQYLSERVAERAARTSSDPSGLGGRVSSIRRESLHATPAWLFVAIERVRTEAERHLAGLTRTSSSHQRLEPTIPVVISSNTVGRTDYVASVKNLRDVPIESVGFEIVEPGEDTVRSGQSADFCLSDPGSVGSGGRIAPGEAREFQLSMSADDVSRLPTLRLSYVLFDDFLFEGSLLERDRLLRRREEQADDIAFANQVRTALVTLPASRVHGFLLEKRAERTKELLAQGRPPDVRTLNEMIAHAERSPERLREIVPAMITRAEGQRQRLLRHLR